MKKKLQAIIKKIRLATLLPLIITFVVLLGCYFFVLRRRSVESCVLYFFNNRSLIGIYWSCRTLFCGET